MNQTETFLIGFFVIGMSTDRVPRIKANKDF